MFLWSNIENQEQLNEHLQKHKERYQKYLVGLYTLREFFPTVDGKIYNVRIRTPLSR